MTIAAIVATLGVLAALLVWRTARRARDYLAIAVLAIALFPLLVTGPTGDVSRYFPQAFSDGPEGVGEIVLASALSTLLIAVILAAGGWWVVRMCWGRFA
jgi:ABC-type branched-subunit amino acid transport system permease subunit